MFVNPVGGMKFYGRKTENAATAIVRLVEPLSGHFTRLVSLWYTCGSTAHYAAIMRPLNKTTVASAASASQAVINITADPGDYSTVPGGGTVRTSDNGIAANDYCVYQCNDGTYVVDTVASVATLAITMTTNVPTGGVAAGAPFWFFGIHSDTNPQDAQAHPKYNLYASVTTYLDNDAGFCGSIKGITSGMTGKGEPVIVYIDNATAAGYLEQVVAAYTSK
jgi:hypothetical protein